MSVQVAIVFVLTFAIHLVSTLAYALRIAGVRTGRVAVSYALFNVLMLVSRTSNTFQGPLLAKHVEGNILRGTAAGAESDFRWLILAATLATAFGALAMPTAQSLFTVAIESFGRHRSVPRLLLRGLSPAGLRHLRAAARPPARGNLTRLGLGGVPVRIVLFNVLATALITVGVFASLHACYLNPELRVTANNLSPVVNALSTILLFVYIDPYLSILTDDVVAGRASQAFFRRCVVLFVGGRLLGTLLAQPLLVPAAEVIVAVAKLL
ncbi:MAG TPA: lipid II flippase Amj family protein [Pyrinomonadaceae bacterium]|nr:lipid II flippase Amj family protein [Pyrinomonadaceae bacterium]